MSQKRFHTFSNGTEHLIWKDNNCFICAKGYDEKACEWRCAIEKAIDSDIVTQDLGLDETMAKRIGIEDGKSLSETLRCREFVNEVKQ